MRTYSNINDGNKGVCSAIIPDEEAPFDPVTGTRAEIMLNPLAVVNRLNPSQNKEQLINFMSDHVYRIMKEKYDNGDWSDALDTYMEYLKYVNKRQYDFLDLEMMIISRAKKIEYVEDIIENGIFIHEPPFVGNTSFEDFGKIYTEHPEWVKEYKCNDIERPVVIADEYFVRLKHESANKMSIRASGMLNIKNQPSKSSLKKEKKALLNDNAIRLGEMEVENLMLTNKPDVVAKTLRMLSTEIGARENLYYSLLTADDPMNINIEDTDGKSISRQCLDKYLSVLELSIDDDSDEISTGVNKKYK